MLADKMLDKVVSAITLVSTARQIALPPFEMSVSLVLMPDPIGFALESLWICTTRKGACVRLNILEYMLRPVRWLPELLHFET